MPKKLTSTLRFFRSGLVRSGLSLAGGAVAGQCLLFLTSLITVRLFTPEEMGQFASVSAVAACLVALSTGRYEMAVPLPRSNSDSLTLARLAIVLGSLFGILLTILQIVAGQLGFSGFSEIFAYVWLLPVVTWSLALFQVASNVAVRSENYRSIAQRAVIYPLVTGILQITAGLFSAGSEGLVLSLAAGQITAFLAMWVPAQRSLQEDLTSPSSWSSLAREYIRFPAFLSFSGTLNALSLQLPLIMITFVFGLHASGQYAIAARIVALPVTLVSQSFGYLYAGEVAKRDREQSAGILSLYFKSSLRLSGFAVMTGIVVYGLSPLVFPVILGDTWEDAGNYGRLLAFAVFGQIIAAPLSQTLTIARMPFTQFMVDIVRVLAILATGLAAAYFEWSADASVFALSAVILLGYGVLWGVNYVAAKRLDVGS